MFEQAWSYGLNSLLRGASGVRIETIERLQTFLNAGVTPQVFELGSIGASGDLVPLSYIAGALTGIDAAWKVDYQTEVVDAITMLRRLGLAPIRLAPKEGLALVNGTSVMTGIAANCIYELLVLLKLAMCIHALLIQGLRGRNQPFHPFIHESKPHPGQQWAATGLRQALSRLAIDTRRSRWSNITMNMKIQFRIATQYAACPNIWGQSLMVSPK